MFKHKTKFSSKNSKTNFFKSKILKLSQSISCRILKIYEKKINHKKFKIGLRKRIDIKI